MRTEKDMENPMENATDEEMSDKDMQDYNIACGISIALGIVAFLLLVFAETMMRWTRW